MTHLTRFTAQAVSAAGAYEYVRLYVGHAKLRVANVNTGQAYDAVAGRRLSLGIIPLNVTTPPLLRDAITLFHEIEQIASGADISWQGDIEISGDQQLVAVYAGTINLEDLYLTVGVELISEAIITVTRWPW